MAYTLVDDTLVERLSEDKAERSGWLFLEPHSEYPGRWKVEGFDPHYFFEFKELIGSYKIVAPSGLEDFLTKAEDLHYDVAFFEDPAHILFEYEHLNDVPDVELNSHFEGTVNGLLPYQVQGYNMLKNLPAGVALWDTGTGKTVLSTALVKHHLVQSDLDSAVVVVKSTNKVNTQRKFAKLGEIDSEVVPDVKKKRLALYEEVAATKGSVMVANYENFREDKDYIAEIFQDRRIFMVWDEMPTKLKTRTTGVYRGVKHCLYDDGRAGIDPSKQRPSWLSQVMTTATPIENQPEDFFNCIRLMDPKPLGTVSKFRKEFVLKYSIHDEHKPEVWHNLDKIGLKTSHLVHQVDKDDPEIAKQFPEVVEEPYIIDWDPKDRRVYEKILSKVDVLEINPIAMIAVLQMVCDAPPILNNSAAVFEAYMGAYEEWDGEGKGPSKEGSESAFALIKSLSLDLTNARHTKQEALRYLLCDRHPEEKICVFSASNESLLPTLEERLVEWGVGYVRYNGTSKQRQAAEDRFMEDPECQVFLSSDLGSDSLDLYEGSGVIHYNLPWKWSTKVQRQNRINRVSSLHKTNWVYTLMMANSVEERKKDVIQRKADYHKGVFKGSIAAQTASAKMSLEDLMYILTGH